MDFKKKWNRFWTLNRHHEDGFTLVELIVVIAILAVLGGASVPAYNLYVKKARESADQQILAAVNNAFASACMESKIDVEEVGSATISVIEGSVNGLSSIAKDAVVRETDARFNLDVIDVAFRRYYEGNENAVFATENVNSLNWVDGAFVISQDFVDTRVVLASGEILVVSAEDMAMIMASSYADMGYSGVAAVVNKLSGSTETLCSLAKTFGMLDKFTAVMSANKLLPAGVNPNSMSANEAANGLQMVTAKYLAGCTEDQINDLMAYDLSKGTTSFLKGIVAGESGTISVSAAAMQMAVVEAFASNDEYKNTTITVKEGGVFGIGAKDKTYTIEQYLKSDSAKNDPLGAMANIQKTDAYKNYKATEQYTNDINGFVGTMSILGDNIGTVDNPGAVNIEAYLKDGINSSDAETGLTAVLGK